MATPRTDRRTEILLENRLVVTEPSTECLRNTSSLYSYCSLFCGSVWGRHDPPFYRQCYSSLKTCGREKGQAEYGDGWVGMGGGWVKEGGREGGNVGRSS